MKKLKKLIATTLIVMMSIGILPVVTANAKAATLANPKISLKLAKNEKNITLSVAKNKGADGYEVYLKFTPRISDLYANINLPGKEFNGHYYCVVATPSRISWDKASAACEKAGGYLATITSQEEQNFIEELNSGNRRFWIGGFRDSSDNWKWVTGEKWDYSNWDDGEPSGGNENSAAVWPKKWNDMTADNLYEQDGYICEWDSIDDVSVETFPIQDGIVTSYSSYDEPTEGKFVQIDNINQKGNKKRTLKLKISDFIENKNCVTFPAGTYSVQVRAYSKNQYGTYIYSEYITKDINVKGKTTKPGYKKSYDFSKVKVGDTIKFGSYEQDADLTNGTEPIEWIVLSKNKSQMLVLSKKVLDSLPYNYKKNSDYANSDWENSTIRKWLNENFYDAAFNASEKKLIKKTTVENYDNGYDNTPAGEDTKDNIFLLSLDEVINKNYGFTKDFSKKDKSRIAYPTNYFAARHYDQKEKLDISKPIWWLLRTPACYKINAVTVEFEGEVYCDGEMGRGQSWPIGIRPAMVISLK